MQSRLLIGIVLASSVLSATAMAQNTNSSTTGRPRTTASPANTNKADDPVRSIEVQQLPSAKPATAPVTPKPKVAARASGPATPQSVTDAFNSLLNGIRKADVNAVTNVYLNSPRLVLFNNNGTVTKGWEQMRHNRESSYKDLKDVKLEVSDVAITMLGRDGAVVTALWKQSQVFRDTPETATGRMTLVFKRVGNEWKAIHLHTSPDRPDPSRVLPSEQTPTPSPNP